MCDRADQSEYAARAEPKQNVSDLADAGIRRNPFEVVLAECKKRAHNNGDHSDRCKRNLNGFYAGENP
jgi:hypothetical protein